MRGAGTSLTTVAARAVNRSSAHGEPDAERFASPVRRAAARKSPADKAGIGASPPTLRGPFSCRVRRTGRSASTEAFAARVPLRLAKEERRDSDPGSLREIVRASGDVAAALGSCSSWRSGSRPSWRGDQRGCAVGTARSLSSTATSARCEPRPGAVLPSEYRRALPRPVVLRIRACRDSALVTADAGERSSLGGASRPLPRRPTDATGAAGCRPCRRSAVASLPPGKPWTARAVEARVC
jgi:hypothetical protein